MAGQICQTSKCLKILRVTSTYTTAEEGLAFLKELADSDLITLEKIDFSGLGENMPEIVHMNVWFDEEQEPVEILLSILAK